MRLPIRIAGVLAVSLSWSTPAFATSTGITGQSGKEGPACSVCHQGGTLPTVVLEGPSSLAPGETGQYSFIIRGGAARTGGADISVDVAAASLQAGTGLKKLGSELTHSAPRAFTDNQVRFDFSLVAPATDVTLTLFGAGNSSNADLDSSGDRAAATKLTVRVGNGSPVVTPDEDGGDGGGGCATAGSVPAWGLVMAGVSLVLLRRRRRRRR
ncbi:MXAN_6652 family MXYO-CTERM-anchored protein [Pyxidicoccus trucidator]|uniref:MXAN_6652 family MXYO-CTERM-anchored protein n=1 Tax=Pyxidicoccus trucidator TaxID=2709662 RepID=UPI0013DA62A7|nr:MXAN_6652 family MXYO-CTERM-anchored protein [Pyxidicoccus trucidator]